MSASATSASDTGAPALTIDVLSDVVCPWCYIGKRRLEAALATHAGAPPRIRWLPFQLNPDIPPDGIDRRAYLEAKFGGADRARQIYARVEAAGREVGIDFRFDRIVRQPNTVDAHRLIAWVQETAPEAADRLVERLFAAYFTEGADLGDGATLVRLAAEAGREAASASAYLDGNGGRDAVAAADAQAKAMGIGGVPFFIFNRRLAVSGAQPPELLRDAMAQAETAP